MILRETVYKVPEHPPRILHSTLQRSFTTITVHYPPESTMKTTAVATIALAALGQVAQAHCAFTSVRLERISTNGR
jgi:hypothetical protein